ncbi:unnamed protein product [Closterium sp. NIES-54]
MAALLAIRNHLPMAECTHFRQHRTAQALYDAVVARYSSPVTAALGRLLLPYLFPELSAFATVADLVTHLRTSNARYHATVPAEFLATNQPPMFITFYFIVSRLPDSLRSVRDHFLSLDPTSLTVDLLEQHLLAGETSAVAVGAARGTPHSPFFEGCSPSPLSPSFASAADTAAADVSVTEDVGAASTSAKRRSSKSKGGRGGRGGSGGGGGGSGSGGGGSGGVGGGSGGGGSGGTGGGSGGPGGGGGGSGGSGGSGGGGTGGGRSGPRRGGPGGGQRQQQQRRSKTQSPQQLREWLVQHGTGGGSETCPYVIRTGVRVGQICWKFHTKHRCFSRLDDAWRAEFGDDVERPRWMDLLRSGVAIFDLDYDAIISAMYALSFSAEGDCYRCVPPDPGIAAAALGASVSGTAPDTAPAEALHTFTLNACASRCFFSDSTTLIPLPAPVPVRLAGPSGGPVVARSSGSLSFCVRRTAALHDAMVTTTTPGGQRVSICTCTWTGRHLATFTCQPGSSLYRLATEPPQVAASARVSTSSQVAPSCSYCLLSHHTLLWHHHLGHPSLPRLCGMHSRFLVSGLPRSLPPLPPLPAPPCIPCVEGRQRAAPHSSSFPLTTAPMQTLHMDVWGPARVSGHGREHYFLLVVDDYTRYTTVFPLRSKGEVPDVLIPWIRTVRLQLHEGFGTDLPVLRLHSDRGGEFSSDLLRDFFMEVARTSMIHAAAPHFLWPFAVRYAAHQLNLWPHVSLPETSPTLRWTGKVGDALVFRVWSSRAFVRDTSADKLSARAIPCVFLGFVTDAPGWQFYHPTSHRVLPSQDVTFDESVPFYRLFPYRSAPPPPPPLFLAPGPPSVDPLPPQGPAPWGAAPDAASWGAASRGAEPGGAGSEGAGSGGAEPEGVEPGDVESEGAESGGAAPQGVALSGGLAGASPQLSSQQLREWLVRRTHSRSGAPGARVAGDTGAGGAAVTAGDGAGTGGVGCAGVGGPGARAGAVDPGAGGAGGIVRPQVYFVSLLQQVLGVPSSTGLPPPFLCPPPDQSQPPLHPASPLPTPSPYTEQSGGLTERREPTSRPISPVCTARRAPRSRPAPVPGTHFIARAASPNVSRLPATAVTDPSFESAAASALVGELLDFATACRLDYATALFAESVSASPPSVGGECALGTDVLEDRQEDFECLAAAVPRLLPCCLPLRETRMLQTSRPRALTQRRLRGVDYFQTFSPTPKMTTLRVLLHVAAKRDYELHSLDFSTAFLHGSLHEEIWLRRPPGFTGMFPADTQWSLRQPLYGLRQAPREWHHTLRTTLAALGFAPSTADPSLFLRTDTSLPPFYVLMYVDDLVFATADIEALTLVLQRFGFQFSSRQPTPLSTSHSLSAPPSDESVEPSGPYPELVGCLMYLMTCTRPDLAYPLSLLARYMAPGRHQKVHWDAAKRVLRYLCSTSGMGLVLGGWGLVVLTGHANASWELRRLTYLLTDLGEAPRSPPVLYVDNKAMFSLCQEHRLEHRTKHIALRYFLARELQQRGQLRLAYVATRANTADVFIKALPLGDHHRFATVLGLVARTNNAAPAPAPAPAPTQARIPDDSNDSENEDGEAPDNLAHRRILAPAPPLPPLNPTPAATTFMRKGVRDQAEVFSAIQAHLRHVEFKLQHGDVEVTLSNVAQIETLINKRFEVLLVADEAVFEAADRFQMYRAKSVLTSRSYKLAVADVAALKCARTGFARGGRLPPRDGETESEGMPPAG